MTEPLKERKIWLVEYRAVTGRWFPCGREFFDLRKNAETQRRKYIWSPEGGGIVGNYRVRAYMREEK